LESHLNLAEASATHTSSNEAELILEIQDLMTTEDMLNDHDIITCSHTKPHVTNVLDCERPLSSIACGGDYDQYGPEFMFAHAFENLDSPLKSQKVGITKVSVGGTEIYKNWMKDNKNNDDNYWNTLVDAIKGTQGTLEAFVWFQGENDSFADLNKENYLNNLTQFVADVRQEIYGTSSKFSSPSDIPVIIIELGYWIQGVDMAVIEAQRAFVANDSKAELVNSGTGTMDENLTAFYHYDAASQLIIGNRVALAMADLLNNK